MAQNRIPSSLASNALERAALAWLNRKGQGYDDGWKGAYKDLAYGGCSSGMVSELIYTQDCERFAIRHIRDILELWGEDAQELSERPMPRKGEELDLNWLAWYGFERAAQNVAGKAGYDAE